MEAVNLPKMSVYITHTTQCHITDDSNLHIITFQISIHSGNTIVKQYQVLLFTFKKQITGSLVHSDDGRADLSRQKLLIFSLHTQTKKPEIHNIKCHGWQNLIQIDNHGQ